MSKSVEEEIREATKVERQEGEADNNYRARLAVAASKVPEATWASLSERAMRWTNSAVISIKNKQPIPELPGSPKVKSQIEPPKKPKKKPAHEPKRVATSFLREVICDNQDWDRRQCISALEEAGHTLGETTKNIIYYDTHAILAILRRKEMLKEGPAEVATTKE